MNKFKQTEEKFKRKSIIKKFCENTTCNCKTINIPGNWTSKLPNKIEIQSKHQIQNDLTFNNPLKRSLELKDKDTKSSIAIESA